ncbi:MAG TPA: hypothetical protein VMH35_14310 [Streptosporangiaceae bacterium]|nr:hypothetical protein [Streptosporangiaceae bacterium]
MALAAGSLPLAVIFALVACMFCAVSIGLLAGELPSAGSLATCAARGLHPSIGFLVASGYVLAAIYIVLNAACIGFFARAARRPNPVLWLVIPVLGIITLVPAWLTSAGIKAFSFVAPLSAPYSYLGPGVAGWMVAGLIYLVYLYRRDRGGWSRSGWCTWTRWRSTSE